MWSDPVQPAWWRRAASLIGTVIMVAVSAALTSALIGWAARDVSGNRMAPWIVGRAAGLTSYLLLVALTIMGLLLSHPKWGRWRHPSKATRLRLHVSLAVFTLAFTALHVVVLATDSYAGVGWAGLLPMGSVYRPVPVTLGVIGLYAGLPAGLTAALAGRIRLRVWWPIHKVAGVALVLVWVHGLQAGADSKPLLWLYLITGGAVLALAASRYLARNSADLVAELSEATGRRPSNASLYPVEPAATERYPAERAPVGRAELR